MGAKNGKSNAIRLMKDSVLDFIALFFPNYCLGCANALVKGEDILCTYCVRDLPKTGYSFVDENPIKTRLLGRLPLEKATAYLKFRKSGIAQKLLHELKYNNHPEIGIKLGLLLGKEMADAGSNNVDIIIPVPLHPVRQRKRGYNQSAKFAEGLSQSLKVPWAESISIRKSNTVTQTKMNRSERWENVKSVFGISDGNLIQNKKVLLVDDVITTGATLEACGLHLIESGCSQLSIACIAEAQ
jgi:Predicted amidophosphoribosyltransferases